MSNDSLDISFNPHPATSFDQLVNLANKKLLPSFLVDIIKQARLFWYPWKHHEVSAELQALRDEPELFTGDFFLPFRTTAIMDSASTVIFQDPPEIADRRGHAFERFFIECTSLGTSIEEFREGKDPRFRDDDIAIRGLGIVWAKLRNLSTVPSASTPLGFRVRVEASEMGQVTFLNERSGWRKVPMPQRVDNVRVAANTIPAMEELAFINSPAVMLTKRVKNTHKVKDLKGRIPLTAERPVYMPMRGKEFLRLISYKPPLGEPLREPRERCAHRRYLKHERFTHKRFTWVFVDSHLVGPKEGISENQKWKYKILMSSEDE